MQSFNIEESKKIGERLRQARIDKKMSQADLAEKIGVSLPLISDIETGKTGMRLYTFTQIVNALEVSADSILRTNSPEVSNIYQNEFSEILSDCSTDEIESILKIVKEVKHTIKTNKS